MFSMLKDPPRPYSRTLASAGTSWVVVTKTLTQLLRELMICRDLSAMVSHWSVRVSISWRSWIQFSRFWGPNRPVEGRGQGLTQVRGS